LKLRLREEEREMKDGELRENYEKTVPTDHDEEEELHSSYCSKIYMNR